MAELVSKAQGGAYLIHSTAKNQHGERSQPLGKRFGHRKTKQGHDVTLVFHSIRKTLATCLQDVGCPEPIAADIMGHEITTMTYGLYSSGSHMKSRRKWLEDAVSIPGIAPEAIEAKDKGVEKAAVASNH